jgi:uncharacterized membrane protein YccF (DUF307 family)
MTWWEILGWFLASGFLLSAFYRRGVRVGIEHALKTLDLDSIQVNKLNKELKKDNITLTKEILN